LRLCDNVKGGLRRGYLMRFSQAVAGENAGYFSFAKAQNNQYPA